MFDPILISNLLISTQNAVLCSNQAIYMDFTSNAPDATHIVEKLSGPSSLLNIMNLWVYLMPFRGIGYEVRIIRSTKVRHVENTSQRICEYLNFIIVVNKLSKIKSGYVLQKIANV